MSNTSIRKDKPAAPEHVAPAQGHAGLVEDLERLFMEQIKPAQAGRTPVQAVPMDDPMMAELARIVGQQAPGEARSATASRQPAMPRAADPFAGVVPDLPKHTDHLDPLKAFEEELRRFDATHRPVSPVQEPLPTPTSVPHAFPEQIRPASPQPTAVDPHEAERLLQQALKPSMPSLEEEFAQLRQQQAKPQTPVAPQPEQMVDPSLHDLRGLDPLPHPTHQPSLPPDAMAYPAEPEPVIAPELAAPPPPRNKRVAVMLGSAAVIALAGVIGAVAFKGGGKKPGDAPVIAAKTQPMKEKPSDPGGVEVPGQDRQVLARKVDEPKSGASVVNKEEQPVDLSQTPKRDGARVILPSPLQAGATPSGPPPAIIMPPGSSQPGLVQPGVAQTAPAAESNAGGFEAKRVRSVKVGNEGAAPAPAPSANRPVAAAAPPAPAPVAPAATPVASKVDRPAAAVPAPAPAKSEARPAIQRPAQSAAATTPGSIRNTRSAAPAMPAEASGEGAPMSLRPPSGTRVASAATPSAPAATSGGSGGYAVQLAAPGSEAEARTVASRLRAKHSDVLGSYSPVVRSAQVGERTVYRVRITGLSRENANSLCSRLKADGGSCFIAGN